MREPLTFFVLFLGLCNIHALKSNKTSLESVISIFSKLSKSLTNLASQSHLKEKRRLSFIELAAKYGHSAEQHEAVTEDGYKLTIFRLPGTKSSLPVLLHHGISDSSDTWIIRGYSSLSITLANDGYDVWLGNNRGNRYSRGHVHLSPDDPTYWNFSFDEIGKYDLAATIDLILSKTGAKKLNAFGHSQGNTIFYVLLSTRTEYNAKVNVMTALAPICYIQDIPSSFQIVIQTSPQLYELAQVLKVTNILGDNSIETTTLRILLQEPVIGYPNVIDGIYFPIAGFDSEELEPDFLPTLGIHFPTWASVKDFIHFGQVGLRKAFANFDYGAEVNRRMYNRSTPPEYDLRKVTAKIALLAGRNDNLSPLKNVAILRRQLPNIVQYTVIPRRKMNHLDYIWGKNAPKYLYKYIFNILQTYK